MKLPGVLQAELRPASTALTTESVAMHFMLIVWDAEVMETGDSMLKALIIDITGFEGK